MNYPIRVHPLSRPRSRSGAAGRGFTLIELLVVIGIIGILISILLPALRRVRYQSRLIDCASRLHQLGIGIMAYAAENKGHYPYRTCANNPASAYAEPWWLVSENGTFDDRELYRSFLQNINNLQCALTPDNFDIENVPANKAILTGYEIWAGAEMVRGNRDTRMFRVGQRPVYNGHRFAVIAADIERWAPFFGKINSGHPDFDRLVPFVSAPPTYDADPMCAFSQYHNPRAMQRSPVDRNFLMDDGSVQRLSRLSMRDLRTVEVPYLPYSLGWASGWLPPVE